MNYNFTDLENKLYNAIIFDGSYNYLLYLNDIKSKNLINNTKYLNLLYDLKNTLEKIDFDVDKVFNNIDF